MKKTILVSASIASAFVASIGHAVCKPTAGYTFTVGAAYKSLQGGQRLYTYGTPIDYLDHVRLSSNTGAAVASLGYGQQGLFSPTAYVGIEINANVGKARSKTNLVGPSASYVAGYRTYLENKYTIGGALRFGLVHNNTLWFISVGGSSGRFNFQYTDVTHSTATNSPLRKKQLGAVTWGFGAQTHFKKVLLKAEVGFAHHKSFKIPTYKPNAYNNTLSAPVSGKLTPRTSIASVSVGYNW